MEIFGYGEDSLTLWILKNRFKYLLDQLEDTSEYSKCTIFYRPSFGRKGGNSRSEFGEFDFIILSEVNIYLGESKWDGPTGKSKNTIQLKNEQLFRHKLFSHYVECWLNNKFSNWNEFREKLNSKLKKHNISKPVPLEYSSLARNLQTVLNIIKSKYNEIPNINNLLLYFYKTNDNLPLIVNGDFKLVFIDYSEYLFDNFIKLN
jgi:hypothetical protein